MRDRVAITRDTEGPADDVLDETTLKLVARPDEPADVWRGQAAIFAATGRGSSHDTEGAQTTYRDECSLRLPADVDVRVGDTVTVERVAGGDQVLVGKVFTVTEVPAASLTVTRRCRIVTHTRGPRV